MRGAFTALAAVSLSVICGATLSAEQPVEGNLNDLLADGFEIVSTVGTQRSNGIDLLVVVQKEEVAAFCQVGLQNVTKSEDSNPVYFSGPWNNGFLCLPLVNSAYDGVVPMGQYQPNSTQENEN
ncbi:hypothetical protein [Ruegeria denitrificans]|uniref:hypothetical protein n=1 Tax=Ruegeria denitrificans TaxID=1715692 RepID=UPI003C79D421